MSKDKITLQISGDISFKDWIKKQRKDSLKILASGYKLDKMIFNGAFLIMLLWFLFVANHYDYNLNYFECKYNFPLGTSNFSLQEPINCTNPFYKPIDWTNYQNLPVGTYGTKPTALFYSCLWLPFLLAALCIYFNHIIHNGRKNGENNNHNGKNE
jgi:hypothetical protein